MVAGGHRQVEGVHYDPSELYAPTASQLTVKLVFANAVRMGFEIGQMDVDTAFLLSILASDHPIILLVPTLGFRKLMLRTGRNVPPEGTYLLRALSCIYGLKQASFYWNTKLSLALISFGWVQCEVDKCLFVKFNTQTLPQIVGCVVFHVDDILAAASRPILEELKASFAASFPMKMPGYP
jgi:hypothetical protein